jgi:glucokinase
VVKVMVNATGTYAVGVDVGGTNIRGGVITRDGKKLSEARRPSRASEGLAKTQQMIIEVVEEAITGAGVPRVELMGVGMGVPGRHDSAAGIVHYSPNFAGWTNIDLLAPIEKHFSVGAFMRNDVKTASMGEYTFGAGRGKNWVVMITLGTGIGGSLIADGKLMLGPGEGFAEVGHMTVNPGGRLCGCGNSGCWEAMAGRDAIIERAVRALQTGRPSVLGEMCEFQPDNVTPALIAKAANDGDALAREVLEETGMWVGIGVANLIQLYNPQVFIIGGGIAQAGDLLFSTIQRTVNWRARMVPGESCAVVPAALGDDAGIFGGACLVFDAAKQ